MLTVAQAEELQQDLIQAFNSNAFQLCLLTLRQAHNPNPQSMRETAMVAQHEVLQKYGFSSGPQGVADMVSTLASFFVTEERLSRSKALAKAKAACIGEESGRRLGWNWPTLAGLPHDTASTAVPSGDNKDVADFSDAGEE